ncbi:hypothetical protein LTR53_003162 [Teratosphaeriaceae sp. CCFEE 6253]|nr:hypothetical protein LTR53_003162 [Teratosphaeriaceae sp. CCFEE 6253]
MPMIWNTEAHAKLFAAIMQQCKIRLSAEDFDALATIMGCTPKAIKHQLTNFRTTAAKGGDDSGDTSTTRPGTAWKASKCKSTKKGGKKAARTPSPDLDDDEVGKGGGPTPPSSSRPTRKGAKRDYAESDDDEHAGDGLSKRVKIEVGEDIGEGLRQTNDDEDEDGVA